MIASLLLASFTYYNDFRFKSTRKTLKYFLIALRFTSISILILLLFRPKWLIEIKQVEKPILVFLQDGSSSILNYEDSTFYKTDFIEILNRNQNQLQNEYEIYNYHFSDSIQEGITNNYSGKYTNLSRAIKGVSDVFNNRNLAGLVLASDGNANFGVNPYYHIEDLNAPVFALAIGDTSIQKDLSLESVRYNEIAYYQNEFPIAFEVLSNFNSNESQQITLSHKNNIIYSEFINVNSNTPLSKHINIEATEEGIQYFDLSIQSFDGEKNTHNNTRRIAIEVVNNLQNILVLHSAPHPDIAALKSALEEGNNYKVTTSLIQDFKEGIGAYNLIILHQIPNQSKQYQNLLSAIINSKSSVLFIGGKASNWSQFNSMQDMVEIKTKNSTQEVFASINTSFTPFKLSQPCTEFIQNSPPLLAPFGEVINLNVDHSLFKQKIKGISTNNDLLVFAEDEERQLGLFLAEGIWKWKLYDYQKNETHTHFNEFIQALTQYLTLSKDKRKLRLQYAKLIPHGHPFKLNAQLYNDNYQLIDDASINLELKDEDGNEFFHTLVPNGSTYNLSINHLNVGTYNFVVNTSYKDKHAMQRGSFAILDAQLEQQKLNADWNLLTKLCDHTNGKLIKKEEFNTFASRISNQIEAQSEVYFSKQLKDIIKLKSIFLLLLLCLALEWTIRKRLGTH